MLLDEPASALDLKHRTQLTGSLRRLRDERGITVLLITHEQEIAEYGSRIVAFRDGLVVRDRPVTDRRLAEDELIAWQSLRAEPEFGPDPVAPPKGA